MEEQLVSGRIVIDFTVQQLGKTQDIANETLAEKIGELGMTEININTIDGSEDLKKLLKLLVVQGVHINILSVDED